MVLIGVELILSVSHINLTKAGQSIADDLRKSKTALLQTPFS